MTLRRLLLVLVPLAIAPGAVAQVSPVVEAEVTALIDASVTEFQVAITCSATLPEANTIYQRWWDESVVESAAQLAAIGFDVAYIDAFVARSDFREFMMDVPFREVVAYCAANEDWERRFRLLQIVFLERELEQIADRPD